MSIYEKEFRIGNKTIISALKDGGTERRKGEKRLYEVFFYLIKHGVRKYHISEDEAASAYSDTIISVIDNIVGDKFEGRSSLKSYTYQIFMNKCVDVVRKHTTNKGKVNYRADDIESHIFTLPDQTRNAVQQMIDRHERDLLLEKLNELGEKCKKLLLLFEDGYNDKEIAREMEYNTPDVVKSTRLRCLEKLRSKVIPDKL
jgi:RNA polymerase sigma factor (sigma-70 family)